MGKKPGKKGDEWPEARRRCRLSDEEVRMAKELGFKCSEGELQHIGREMAKKYRETYKSDPPKHKQFTGGMYIPVNSYMERDRAMMEQVIRSVVS